jgi:DHA3 family macrolide efflux protein-like MFS transporter
LQKSRWKRFQAVFLFEENFMAQKFAQEWQKKAFLFLLSQNLSLFGSSSVGFALVWHITLQTTSGLWMSAAVMACNLPQILLLLWGGVWADRYNRRLLIILSDGFVAVLTLGLALLFWGGLENLWLLIGVLVLRSLGSGVQAPASAAVYTQIVPASHLGRIQGINQTLNAALMLLAPAAGGFFLATMSLAWVMLLDVITALLAIMVMWPIKVPDPAQAEKDVSARRQIGRGLSYTLGHGQLKLLLAGYGAFFFLLTPAAALSPLLIARSFGEEVWRLTANEIVWSGMSVLGGLFMAWRGEFADKPRVIALCISLWGICFGLMGLTGSFTIFLALMGAGGFLLPLFNTTVTVFIQKETEPAVLGRVFSIFQIVASGGLPAAILIFGPLAEIVSVELLLQITGFFMIGSGFLYNRAVKRQVLQGGVK